MIIPTTPVAAIAAHRRLRRAFVVLWMVGAGLAGGTALIEAAGDDALAQAVGYAVTAALLIALAKGTARGSRLAVAVGLVLCAVQPLAVVITAWELTHEIPHAEALKLRALGVAPTIGVAINLCLAAYASVLAVWACSVWRTRSS